MTKKYLAIPTKGFKRELRKLNDVERALIFAKIELMEIDPFYPSLRTKKMKGQFDLFESRVNRDIRILWKFRDNKIILLFDVGHHDVLKKY